MAGNRLKRKRRAFGENSAQLKEAMFVVKIKLVTAALGSLDYYVEIASFRIDRVHLVNG